ncbi:hypothethical protein [Ralstonia solanacearum PSI07]|nr:hypothethical protein [Ralstonia solanacearum PSI07]
MVLDLVAGADRLHCHALGQLRLDRQVDRAVVQDLELEAVAALLVVRERLRLVGAQPGQHRDDDGVRAGRVVGHDQRQGVLILEGQRPGTCANHAPFVHEHVQRVGVAASYGTEAVSISRRLAGFIMACHPSPMTVTQQLLQARKLLAVGVTAGVVIGDGAGG